MNFPCIRCGLCCIDLPDIPEADDCKNKKGDCRYFDIQSKLCTIHEQRPLFCNIEAKYHAYYENNMTEEEYMSKMLEACIGLAKRYKSIEILETWKVYIAKIRATSYNQATEKV